MIFAVIRTKVLPKKYNDALKILRLISAKSKDRSGCLGSHIYTDAQEDDVIMYEEVWESERDLDRHLRSDEYRNLLLVLEMGAKQPEIRFNTVSSMTGIETIEKARSHVR